MKKKWVENGTGGKGSNGYRPRKKLEEEHKPDRHRFAKVFKSILIDLNEEGWILKSVREGTLIELTTFVFIIGNPLLTFFPLLLIINFLDILVMSTTIMMSTYAIIQGMMKVIDKCHLLTKGKTL